MTTPLRLALLLALVPPAVSAPSSTLEHEAAEQQRAWDAAAPARDGAAAPSAQAGSRTFRPPERAPVDPEIHPFLFNIDRILASDGQPPDLYSITGTVRRLTIAQKDQLHEWRDEIEREGDLNWLARNAPPPDAHDRRMLDDLQAAMPLTNARHAYFVPFMQGDHPSLFAEVLGFTGNVVGFEFKAAGTPFMVVDSSLPPVTKWMTTIHELLHTREATIPRGGESMSALLRGGAGRCEDPGDASVLYVYLLEGYTQRVTLQIVARLLRVELTEQQRRGMWRRLMASFGAGGPRPPEAEERAGRDFFDDFAELRPSEAQNLARRPLPDSVHTIPNADAYAERVAVVGAALRDEAAAHGLIEWVIRGDASEYYARLGRERIVLSLVLSRMATMAERLEAIFGSTYATERLQRAYTLFPRTVRPDGDTAEQTAEVADLQLRDIAAFNTPIGSMPPTLPAATAAAWRREFACRPLTITRSAVDFYKSAPASAARSRTR